jgi:hypothetical protein
MEHTFGRYLNSAWAAAETVARLVEQVAELESACQNMTANYNKVGGGGGGGGSCDGGSAALADLRSKYIEAQMRLVHAETELARFCKKVGGRDGQVLRYRYVLRLEWPQILDVMTRRGYECCLRTMFRWHDQARRNARMIWEEQHAQYETVHPGA